MRNNVHNLSQFRFARQQPQQLRFVPWAHEQRSRQFRDLRFVVFASLVLWFVVAAAALVFIT